MEHNQVVAHGLHVVDDVCGEQYQPVARHAGKEVAEADALLGVQADGRFVENQERRVAQQGLRDAHALALPAGKRADARAGLFFQPHGGNRLLHGGAAVLQPLERGHVGKELGCRQLVKQPEILRQIAKLRLQRPLRAGHGAAVYKYRALRGQKRRHQQLHQRGFARAVRPQQPHQAGAAQGKAHAVQGALAVGIGHFQVLNLNMHSSHPFIWT